ncbi:MAG: CAAX prenyl protease-related protein [Planctomycetota bacterium]
MNENDESTESTESTPPPSRNLTLAFMLPLLVSLLVTMFYPQFAESYEGDGWGESPVPAVTYETWLYLAMVTVQVAAIFALLVYFWRDYVAGFPLRVSWLSVVVGMVGVVVWVLLTQLGLEHAVLKLLEFDSSRPSFNPFVIQNTLVLVLFFVARFLLLTLANPIAEELFVRGWLVRWVHNPNFEEVTFAELTWKGLLAASVYGIVSHPSEAIAAFVWFGLVTWLMRRTGSLWDCVVAHAVTNLLLGIYVVAYQQWQLW